MSHEESTIPMVGATFGYQLSLGHPNNLYFDLQAGIAGIAGTGVGLSWQQSSSKERSIRGKLFWPFPVGLWELNMTASNG